MMQHHYHSTRFLALFLYSIPMFICLGISQAWGDNSWGEIALDHKRANLYYQYWFKELAKTDESLDVTVVIRVRAFGKRSEMIEAWNKNWQNQIPNWNWAKTLGCFVTSGSSTDIPELWMELKKDTNGNLVFPMHVLGHEVVHAIQNRDKRVGNPDNLTRIEFVQPSNNDNSPGVLLKGFQMSPSFR